MTDAHRRLATADGEHVVAERPELWELRVAVVATTAQADELMDRIAGLLGPDPVPWSVAQVPGWHLDPDRRAAYDALVDGEA